MTMRKSEPLVCICPASEPVTGSTLSAAVDYLVTNVPTGLPPTDGTRLPSHVAFGLWALGYSPRVNFSLLDPKGNVLFCGNVQKWMDKRHEFSRVNDWRASA